MKRIVALLFLFCILLRAVPGLAQQEAATIVGEITDPSGAVVPGAAVEVLNVATGITVTTTAKRSRRLHGAESAPGPVLGDHLGGRLQPCEPEQPDTAGRAGG